MEKSCQVQIISPPTRSSAVQTIFTGTFRPLVASSTQKVSYSKYVSTQTDDLCIEEIKFDSVSTPQKGILRELFESAASPIQQNACNSTVISTFEDTADDPEYFPSDSDVGNKLPAKPLSVTDEKKFVVFESRLDELFVLLRCPQYDCA